MDRGKRNEGLDGALVMRAVAAVLLLVVLAGCAAQPGGESSSAANSEPSASPSSWTPVMPQESQEPDEASDHVADASHFYANVATEVDGDFLVVTIDSLPDHKSVYWPTSDERYQAYNGPNPNFHKNPNSILENHVTFRIPRHPTAAATITPTSLGPIGVAVNGVPLFNQYAGPNQPLTNEIDSFDQFNGHPQQQGQYHYHVEPTHLTARNAEALLGFLLDGYPVYGPEEFHQVRVSADLDAQHGHTHQTPDFGEMYHYHFTADAPYLNGNGFHGIAGTRS